MRPSISRIHATARAAARRLVLSGLALLALTAPAGEAPPSREQVLARLAPYAGASVAGVDRTTMAGKVLTGYQGWFTTPTDGAGRGWTHYGRDGGFAPGRCSIELWPDVAELGADERFATDFRHPDGSVAEVFSSFRRATVLRHFAWMRDYGIDAALVQRFAVQTRDPRALAHLDGVLRSCQEGANRSGRAWALMYDLSGLGTGANGIDVAIADWKALVDRMRLGRDPNDRAYLRHGGKPLVAVWGVGFDDDRPYTLADCERLIDLLTSDAVYGGNTVMLGVPYHWRERKGDAIADPDLHRVLAKADVISPWAVGRFGTGRTADDIAAKAIVPDLAWCKERGLDYLPVVFPGFSWSNLKPGAAFDQIPRLRGEFLWRQCVAARRGGAGMVYVAMFDELDEATAIFKCRNDPPVGASRFVAEAGLPSDHYLWLTGQAGRMLRGELPASAEPPSRPR